jgi:gliding motility-associated-like protein
VGQAPFAFLDVPDEVIICDDSPARIPFATNAPGIEIVGDVPGPYEIRDGFVLVEIPGTYIFRTVDPSGTLCPNILSTELIFTEPGSLPADFNFTYSICPEDPIEDNRRAVIDPGDAFLSIRYLDEEGGQITGTGPDYSLDGTILTVFRAGPVTIELTNPFGCVTTERINIIEDCQARFTAPDAFRPGSDLTENQTWKIYPFLIDTEDFQVFIFNRWGEMIFQSTDLAFEWNGGYDNDASRPVPVGTYAYKVQFKASFDDGKGTQELRGKIVLVR